MSNKNLLAGVGLVATVGLVANPIVKMITRSEAVIAPLVRTVPRVVGPGPGSSGHDAGSNESTNSTSDKTGSDPAKLPDSIILVPTDPTASKSKEPEPINPGKIKEDELWTLSRSAEKQAEASQWPYGNSPKPEFYIKVYNEFERTSKKLLTVFKESDPVYLDFLDRCIQVFKDFNKKTHVEYDCKKLIIPDYLIEPTKSINLNTYYLFTGVKLSLAQQKLLTELTSLTFNKKSGDLARNIVLETCNEGYVFRTINSEKITSDLKELMRYKPLSSKQILYKEELPLDVKEFLKLNKVKLVAEAQKYIDLINRERREIDILIVAPESDQDLMEAYGIAPKHLKNFKRKLEELAGNPNVIFVKSAEDLEEKLSKSYENRTAFVVFNNKNNKIFGRTIDNYYLLENILTCNSINIQNDNITYKTLDYIYVSETFNALKKMQNRKKRIDEFYTEFTNIYNQELSNSNTKRNASFVIFGISGSGAIAGAYYLGLEHKKEKI